MAQEIKIETFFDRFSFECCTKIGWIKNKQQKKKQQSNSRNGKYVDVLVENDRSTPNFNFQSFDHFPAASQVTHPICAEAVQTDGITNGYISQQPSTGQSVLNYSVTL